MRDFPEFDANDLTQDPRFVQWVKNPGRDGELDEYWRNWLEANPHRVNELNEAKQIILAIVKEGEFEPFLQKERVWAKLSTSILEDENTRKASRSYSRYIFRVAASVLLVAASSFGIWWFVNRTQSPSTTENFTASSEAMLVETNHTEDSKTILLSDGSSVILRPNSTLRFKKEFEGSMREISLTGEAFFEVAKNPEKPFIVYANELVTKVLGTSFNIRAYENEENVSVFVKTGKVSVFTEKDVEANANKSSDKLHGTLLAPNQQVIFSRNNSELTKSLVEDPALLKHVPKNEFLFQDTPIKDVFVVLEEAYGVTIVYDEDVMANCSLNASLEDMPLYDKLRLICKGINAEYKILDSHIVVSGNGCD